VTERLLSTGEAAREIGVARRTLAAWAAEGTVRAALYTVGGHARWDLDDLRRQLVELRQRTDG
jgi:DNA-binding transcriptional MerR regulator